MVGEIYSWTTKNGYTVSPLLHGARTSYLISHNHKHVLVDVGTKNKYQELKDKLNYCLNGDKLNYLILTHTHFDHVQNTSSIKEDFEPLIIVNKKEADDLSEGKNHLAKGYDLFTKFILLFEHPIFVGYDGVKADILVDKDNFKVDDLNIKIILTPGHTIGSMSVIVDNEIALCGDTIFGAFKNSIMPPFVNDRGEIVKSWEKLVNTPCRMFFPGHGHRVDRQVILNEISKRK